MIKAIALLGCATLVLVPANAHAAGKQKSRSAKASERLSVAPTFCTLKLTNGEHLAPEILIVDGNVPTHVMAAINGTSQPAFVKILGGGGRPRLTYIAPGARLDMPFNNGRYQIQYALGGRLAADCETVIGPKHVAEFPDVYDLRVEWKSSTDYRTTTVEFTLHEVLGGKVQTDKITVAEFNRD